MKVIPITQGYACKVDDGKYEMLSTYPWYALITENLVYAVTNIKKGGKWTIQSMHRLIMGNPKGKIVDHINNNGLDNQEHNLRPCTYQQNYYNSRPRAGTSKFKGVSWHKKTEKWCVQITIDRKVKHIGLFESETEAAIRYNEVARQHYGEFAWLNTIETPFTS